MTDITLPPFSPLTVLAQDYAPLYTIDLLPECSRSVPWTHLKLYPTPDEKSLNLNSWNCSDGFVDLTAQLKSLLKEGREYTDLASHEDGKVYVMFDQGDGPEIEEWTVPISTAETWTVARNVTVRDSV